MYVYLFQSWDLSLNKFQIIGLVLGLILYSIGRKNKPYARIIYGIVSIISNIFRSTPFMILMVLIIPFTKAIVGTMLGAQAAIPALVLSAAPFYARLVEIAFREVSPGVLEALSPFRLIAVLKNQSFFLFHRI
ncbi:hypothetical protein EfmAA242_06240 [Enterococcus faecium]|nr:hypothetical protein EfmAA242_06240 [Enterococcus faecium]